VSTHVPSFTEPADRPTAPAWLLPTIIRFPRAGSEGAQRTATESLFEHTEVWGAFPADAGREQLVDELVRCKLTGRGGGHFPVARKWRGVMATAGGGYAVANGAEGEPLSAKDAALLQTRPHLVLDGLQLAAIATRAEHSVIWLHAGATATRASLAKAIAERRVAGLPGPHIQLITGPDRYLTGESSAVVNALSGGPPLPTFRRKHSSESGVNGAPTLLHNVETLARIAAIARGLDPTGHVERGGIPSALFTVLTPTGRTVTEIRPDTTLGQLVNSHVAETPQAVLLGGYGGNWVPWAEFQAIPASEPAAQLQGRSTGAGIVAPLPTDGCGIAETGRILEYLADSSARQCGPCLFGLRAVADLVSALARGELGRADRKRLERYRAEIDGRGGCHHPDGAMRLLASMFTTFAVEVDLHLRRGPCRADTGPRLIPVPSA